MYFVVFVLMYEATLPYLSVILSEDHMVNKDAAKDIMTYLKQTYKIREISEDTKLQGFIDGYDREGARFTVAPWDLEQIVLNTEADDSHMVRESILEAPDLLAVEDIPGNVAVARTVSDVFGQDVNNENDGAINPDSILVEDAFKWYLYHKIMILSQNGTKPVGISDGVFAIKNELFLPDDFIPSVMMEMVEGSKVVDVMETVKNIQPTGQKNAIFILAKHDSGKFLEPHWFYYNSSISGVVPEGLEKLGGKISESFAEFQNTSEYEDFLFSRIMRNVIFTVETKKKRELGKPLFDPGKLRLLEKRGVVKLDNNVGTVIESISIEQLKKMKSEAELGAGKVSDLWMSSTIPL